MKSAVEGNVFLSVMKSAVTDGAKFQLALSHHCSASPLVIQGTNFSHHCSVSPLVPEVLYLNFVCDLGGVVYRTFSVVFRYIGACSNSLAPLCITQHVLVCQVCSNCK